MLVDIRAVTIGPNGILQYSDINLATASMTNTGSTNTGSTSTGSTSPGSTSAGSTSTTTSRAGSLINWNPSSQFQHATAAAQASVNKTGTFRAIFAGDSTTSGVGATRLTSAPAYVAATLNTVAPSLTGFNEYVAGGDSSDTRMVFSANTKFSGQGCFGGQVAQIPDATSGLTFTPGIAFDTVRVIYCDLGHAFDILVNGLPSGKPVPAGTGGGSMLTNVWQVAHGANTIGIVDKSTAQYPDTFVQSIEVWDSTVAGFTQIVNGGQGGIDTSWINQSTTFAGYTSGMLAEAGNIAVINLGTNDMNNGAPSLAAFQTNLTAAVTNLQAKNCDVILVFPPDCVSSGYAANGTAFLGALKSIASSKNVPVIDLRNYFGSRSTWSPNWIYDNLHDTAVFYQLVGTLYAKLIAVATGQATSAVVSEVAGWQ